ncbi:MAG TPA: CHAD domain-containing protein [Gaiellaceae bacterium]|nr:CHAD domain-containing protein [Gaiellaceae bacterium]
MVADPTRSLSPADEKTRAPVGRVRPHLRLVEPPRADPGPISPELVLVCPELARLIREGSEHDSSASSRGGSEPGRAWGGRGPESLRFDTDDLRLERQGISLERRTRDGAARWILQLPRGEVVHMPGDVVSMRPPERIRELIRTATDDAPLGPAEWKFDDARATRLQAYVLEQRDALLRHDPGARLGTDPENLHQVRVAARRLRTSLRMAHSLVDDEWADPVRAELGELGRAAGPVRDLDVLLERLNGELASLDASELDSAEAILSSLEADRRRLHEQLVQALDDPAYRELLERLGAPIRIAASPGRRTLRKLAERELDRVVKDVERIGADPSPEAMHAMRIKVKRMRYAFELGGEPSKHRTVRVVDAAKALQDLLGDHHDTVVGEQRLKAFVGGDPDRSVAFVAGRLAERERFRREQVERHLPAAWRQLRRTSGNLR